MHYMRCETCGSEKVGRFVGEIVIHFPGASNIDKAPVFVFPELVVCISCGGARFFVPEDQLRLLEQGVPALR
jgi:hypothetical protein